MTQSDTYRTCWVRGATYVVLIVLSAGGMAVPTGIAAMLITSPVTWLLRLSPEGDTVALCIWAALMALFYPAALGQAMREHPLP